MPRMRITADRLVMRSKADLERTIMRYFLIGLRLSGRAFLIEVEQHVPVFTGMALGSMLPLAKIVRYNLPIYGNPKEAYVDGQKVMKDAGLGESQGSAYLYKSNAHTAVLRVETKVYHYDLRDVNEISDKSGFAAPTPWRSFELGAEAANRELNEYLEFKLQNLVLFSVKSRVTTSLTESPVDIIQ